MATFLRSRATLQIPGQGSPSLITRYWDSTGAGIGALATEAVARDRAFFNSLAASVVAGSTYTPNLVVDEIDEVTGNLVNQIAAAPPAAVAFTGAFDALPYFVQGLMRLSTNLFVNGRRTQGRMFIPGLMENGSAGAPAAPTAALVTSLTTAAATLSAVVVSPINQRVWHRPSLAGPGLSTVVTARSIAPTWAVLKSRRI